MKNTIKINKKINSFKKEIEVPGDKSISIRCVLLGSQAIGVTKIYNLLERQDILMNDNLPIIINPDTFYDFKYIYKKDNEYYYGVLIFKNNKINSCWFKINFLQNKLERINFKIKKEEHPYELYVYDLSEKIYEGLI